MVSDTTITVIIDTVAFALSVGTSMFVSGTRWGRVETQLQDLQTDRVRQSDIAGLRERLSRIDGMFTLTFKGEERK